MYLSPLLSGLFCRILTKNSTAPLATSSNVERPEPKAFCCIEADVSTRNTMIVILANNWNHSIKRGNLNLGPPDAAELHRSRHVNQEHYDCHISQQLESLDQTREFEFRSTRCRRAGFALRFDKASRWCPLRSTCSSRG